MEVKSLTKPEISYILSVMELSKLYLMQYVESDKRMKELKMVNKIITNLSPQLRKKSFKKK